MTGTDPVTFPIDGTLDLHAFDPKDVRDVVRDYVEAAHAKGLTDIRIVHGRGRGVLRGVVQATLDADRLVEAFWDEPESHLGATGARLALGRDSAVRLAEARSGRPELGRRAGFGIRDSEEKQ